VRLALALAITALTTLGAPLDAQRRARLELTLPPPELATSEGPTVRSPRVLAERQVRDLLRNGFPARLHYRLELWSVGGMLNDLERTTEWDVIVRYDALDRTYAVARLAGGQVTVLGRFEQFDDAQEAVERPYRAPITAPRRGRGYYYNLILDVEMLSLSDLDEVERWLKGELRPAVRGRRNPGTALTRGVRTLFVRLIGGERRHYELRSGRFTPE
jgi:hypothetical protein